MFGIDWHAAQMPVLRPAGRCTRISGSSVSSSSSSRQGCCMSCSTPHPLLQVPPGDLARTLRCSWQQRLNYACNHQFAAPCATLCRADFCSCSICTDYARQAERVHSARGGGGGGTGAGGTDWDTLQRALAPAGSLIKYVASQRNPPVADRPDGAQQVGGMITRAGRLTCCIRIKCSQASTRRISALQCSYNAIVHTQAAFSPG